MFRGLDSRCLRWGWGRWTRPGGSGGPEASGESSVRWEPREAELGLVETGAGGKAELRFG